jgi:hypothetical protein
MAFAAAPRSWFSQLRKVQDRKEVKPVRYEQPAIKVRTDACAAIQGGKGQTVIPESGTNEYVTTSAYQADE